MIFPVDSRWNFLLFVHTYIHTHTHTHENWWFFQLIVDGKGAFCMYALHFYPGCSWQGFLEFPRVCICTYVLHAFLQQCVSNSFFEFPRVCISTYILHTLLQKCVSNSFFEIPRVCICTYVLHTLLQKRGAQSFRTQVCSAGYLYALA
jgi:hypothetical protein